MLVGVLPVDKLEGGVHNMIFEKIIDIFFTPLMALLNLLPTPLVETISEVSVPNPIKYGT